MCIGICIVSLKINDTEPSCTVCHLSGSVFTNNNKEPGSDCSSVFTCALRTYIANQALNFFSLIFKVECLYHCHVFTSDNGT